MSRVRKRPRWMLVFGAVVAATAAAVVVPTLPANGGTNSSQSPAATAPAAKGLPLWTNVTSSVVGTPPSPRSEPAIANQPWGGYDLMFGGIGSDGTILGDTWALFDNNWVDLNLPGSPPARAGASMAFLKGFREYMVMFGGIGSNGQVLGDTWQFQGGNWTQLHPTVSPSPRQLSTLIYSPADNEMLLFGGTNATKTVFYNDTWSFRNGQWTATQAQHLPAGPGCGRDGL